MTSGANIFFNNIIIYWSPVQILFGLNKRWNNLIRKNNALSEYKSWTLDHTTIDLVILLIQFEQIDFRTSFYMEQKVVIRFFIFP